jgi:hypothetical protein
MVYEAGLKPKPAIWVTLFTLSTTFVIGRGLPFRTRSERLTETFFSFGTAIIDRQSPKMNGETSSLPFSAIAVSRMAFFLNKRPKMPFFG